MLGRKRLEALCDMFIEEIGPEFKTGFRMQTNGMLVTEEWVKLFHKYDMHVGVSIDGDEQANDLYRVDHQGKGTYSRVKKGIDVLQAAVSRKELRPVGGLCVINPKNSGADTYRHLVHELGFTGFNFLLPLDDYDHLTSDDELTAGYGVYLCEAFDAYVAEDDPTITVRLFETAIQAMTGGANFSATMDLVAGHSIQSIVLSSNGEIGPDDTLRPTSGQFFTGKYTIFNSSLKSYLHSGDAKQIRRASCNLNAKCNACKWRNACYGGPLINRYSKSSGFDNPSALCQSLYTFHQHVNDYLIGAGIPETIINDAMEWRP